MKQKDLLTIVAWGLASAIISILIAKFTFGAPKNRQQTVEVVPAISASFPTPDQQYFNKNSIDPTQSIQIGTNNNLTPFTTPTPGDTNTNPAD